jgi:hypothetical protein
VRQLASSAGAVAAAIPHVLGGSRSEGGGIMVTDPFNDNAGRASGQKNTDHALGTPSATLLVPTLTVPSWSKTVYDGAGRCHDRRPRFGPGVFL